jgi:hypothetical protein
VVAGRAQCKSGRFTAFLLVTLLCSIQLLERFYDPLSGHISLDGEPINEFNVQEYRQQVSLVSQEPVSTVMILGSVKTADRQLCRLCMQELFASTSGWVPPNQNLRSHKKISRLPAVMPIY